MIRIVVFCFILAAALAVREKQIKLEDIEKDNLANERKTQLGEKVPIPHPYVSPPQPQVPFHQPPLEYNYNFPGFLEQQQHQQQPQTYLQPQAQSQQFQEYLRYVQPQYQQPELQQQQQFVLPPKPQPKQLPTKPKFQFGFKPMKTAANFPEKYAQVPPQLAVGPQQFTSQNQQQQQYPNANQQQFSNPNQPPITITPTQPQYVQYYQPEHYLGPSKSQLYVNAKSQYQNIDLVSDNHLQSPDSAVQQYYANQQQQYVYLSPSASTSIQQVVDPKGQIQYVMYVPQYYTGAKADATQNIETLVDPQVQNVEGSEPVQYQYVQVPESQYQAQNQQEVEPKTEAVPQPQISPVPSTPLVPQRPKFDFYSRKHQAKSLLDSYIPSYLQIQYYKQQQQNHANAIRHSLKPLQEVVGKTDAVKQYAQVPAYEPEERPQATSYSTQGTGKFVSQETIKRPRYLHRPLHYTRTHVKN